MSILCAAMIISVIVIPIVGGIRDKMIVDNCSTYYNWSGSVKTLFICHEIANGFVLLITFILRVYSAMIILTSIYKWDESYREIREKRYNKDKNWKSLSEKYIYLHNNYIKVGEETNPERETLKRWFVVQYGVYLILVLIELVHIMLKVINSELKRTDNDTWHSFVYLFYDLLAFLIPYCMGSWLNFVHQRYYKEIKMALLEKITWNARSEVDIIQPGYQNFTYIKEQVKPGRKLSDDDYKNHYLLLAKEQSYLDYITDFAFVPSIFGITIPLDSQGYTFTIILSIVSIVFNFAY